MPGCIVRSKGGSHTARERENVSPTSVGETVGADLDVVRKMATRDGDDTIARVLNTRARRTRTGEPWGQLAVKTARRKHGLDRRAGSLVDADMLTLQGAEYPTSETTIKKHVNGGILRVDQVLAVALSEIRRTDLDGERRRAVLIRLTHTGRVVLGDTSDTQRELFP